MGVAVANILANEEILEREQEKSQLLSISEQLSTIRDKHSLFTVIFDKLKPIFHFDDAVVVLADAQRRWVQHLQSYANQDGRKDTSPAYQQLMSSKLLILGSPYERHLQLTKPQVYPIYEFLTEHYSNYIGLQLVAEFGYVESLYMPLLSGSDVLGTLEFHNKRKGFFPARHLPLYQHIADQVAVAVANILANEEILERERERSAQLSLNNALVTLRDPKRLFQTIAYELNEFVRFDTLSVRVFAGRNLLQYAFLMKQNGHFDNITQQVNDLYPGIEQAEGIDSAARDTMQSAIYTGSLYDKMVGQFDVYRMEQTHSGIRSGY